MRKVHENPSRIMVKEPLTMTSLTNDLRKVFTDEIEAFGNDFSPIGNSETKVLLNSGESAKVPTDAQKLLFLANQYKCRAEVLYEDVSEKIVKIFEEYILRERDEGKLLLKFSEFLENEITCISNIQKFQAYKAREEVFKDLAMLIIDEHIGHDSTHAECATGIGIRKDWAIVKLHSSNRSDGEFKSFTKDILEKNQSDDFEGLDDLIN